MKLTDSERYTLINALHIAADQYERDAVDHPILAVQFGRQAEEAKALAERLLEEE